MIYSSWLGSDFTYVTSGPTPFYKGTIAAPEITETILNEAEINVYARNLTGFTSQPFIYYKLNYTESSFWITTYFHIGEINILSGDHIGGSSWGFRYVIIPGGVHARLAGGQARSSSPPPDMNDYRAVCAYYGIPE